MTATIFGVSLPEIGSLFLNGLTIEQFIAYSAFALLGLLLALVIDVVRRKPDSAGSPKKFSFKYYLSDNRERLIVSMILIPVAVVLYSVISGKPMNQAAAFYIGWSGDVIAEILKRKTNLFNTKN